MESVLVAAGVVEGGAGYEQAIRTGKHHFKSDEPAHLGGTDAGPAPYQLLVAALGACTGITLKMYAERKKWELGTVKVSVKLFRDGETERIERTVSCSGALTQEQRDRLAEICGKTPVTKTLLGGLKISTTVQPA